MTLSITPRREGTASVVALTGQLDAQSAAGLRQLLTELLTDPAPQLVIDLTGTTHLDATGLGVLVGAARRAHDAGGQLRLAAPTPAILDVLQITGLTRVLQIHLTVADALSPTSSRPE